MGRYRIVCAMMSCVCLAGCDLANPQVVVRQLHDAGTTGGTVAIDGSSFPDSLPVDTLLVGGPDSLDTPSTAPDTDREFQAPIADAGDATLDHDDDATLPVGRAVDGLSPSVDCAREGYVFCDGFEHGAGLWSTTTSTWRWFSLDEHDQHGDGNKVFGPAISGTTIAYVTSRSWHDMTVQADVMVTSFGQATASNRTEVYARYQDSAQTYAIALRGDGYLDLRNSGTGICVASKVMVAENEWHTLKIRVAGSVGNVAVEGYLDDVLVATASDATLTPTVDSGSAGIGVYGNAEALFDNVLVSSP